MNTSASGGFDGYATASAISSPEGRHFVPRLAFTASPKLEYDQEEIAQAMRTGLSDALFFCDTSLFDDHTAPAIWTALLGTHGQVVIIPPVRQELEPWIKTHASHIAAQAVVREDPAFLFLSYDEFDEIDRAALSYYVNLLGFRKRLFDIRAIRFEADFGRPPDDEEMKTLRQEVHQDFGPRGYLLARKGAAASIGETFYTDEYLVCLAAMTAVATGREVVILTKDEDIQEQFYKLQWLLDTHYRGMLLADRYAVSPLHFVSHPLPETVPNIEDAFDGDNNVLIERSREMLDAVLPSTCTSALTYCWVLGERLTQMGVCLEVEMRRLFRVKAFTHGLNTDALNGQNCHIWLAPLEIPAFLRECAAIVMDRRLPIPNSSVSIPILDFQEAAYCGETYRHLRDEA